MTYSVPTYLEARATLADAIHAGLEELNETKVIDVLRS